MSQHLFDQWCKTTCEGVLAMWALKALPVRPCWRSQEQAMLVFCSECEPASLGVAEDDSRPIGQLPAGGRRRKASWRFVRTRSGNCGDLTFWGQTMAMADWSFTTLCRLLKIKGPASSTSLCLFSAGSLWRSP